MREPRPDWVSTVAGLHTALHETGDALSALEQACLWLRGAASARDVIVCDATGRRVAGGRRSAVTEDGARLAAEAVELREAVIRQGAGGASVAVPIGEADGVRGAVLIVDAQLTAKATLEGALALAAVAGPDLGAALAERAAASGRTMDLPGILGTSAATVAIRAAVRRAGATRFPVLIEGESGTGKELVARALHAVSERRRRPLRAVNCAALTDELVEAELFGYARGAFTGAVTARVGLFEESNGGSLLLDEVGELSARAQAKLLRTLQEGEIRRLGENATRRVDVRVIAATNVALADAVRDGRFRQDLLFRLAVVRLRVPPLRERIDDVPILARAFWRDAIRQAGKQARLAPDAIARLCRRRWPGNVRELQNVMAALAVLAPSRGRVGAALVRQAILDDAGAEAAPLRLSVARARCERQAVVTALARHGGRRAAAARELGLTRQGLAKAMRRLGLDRRASAGVA